MTEADYPVFMGEFDRLHAALAGYRSKPDEARAKADAYFHAMKHLSLSDVTAKADAWLQRESKMPKPVEWASVRISRGVEMPTFTPREEREYLRAEALHYEDAPCGCPLCFQAGVSDKPIRFVPDFTPDDRDDRVRIGERIVTRGHWSHGVELARYYKARADFWNRYYEMLGKRAFPKEPPRHSRPVVDFVKVGA